MTVALAVEVIRRRDRGDGADKIKLARTMVRIKLCDDRVILVKISLRAAQRRVIRGQERSV